jgi:hypothetical protein
MPLDNQNHYSNTKNPTTFRSNLNDDYNEIR